MSIRRFFISSVIVFLVSESLTSHATPTPELPPALKNRAWHNLLDHWDQSIGALLMQSEIAYQPMQHPGRHNPNVAQIFPDVAADEVPTIGEWGGVLSVHDKRRRVTRWFQQGLAKLGFFPPERRGLSLFATEPYYQSAAHGSEFRLRSIHRPKLSWFANWVVTNLQNTHDVKLVNHVVHRARDPITVPDTKLLIRPINDSTNTPVAMHETQLTFEPTADSADTKWPLKRIDAEFPYSRGKPPIKVSITRRDQKSPWRYEAIGTVDTQRKAFDRIQIATSSYRQLVRELRRIKLR